MQIGANTMVYALNLERIDFSDQYTFACLLFKDGEWKVRKSGNPNCILQSYNDTPDKARILVNVGGLSRLKVSLNVRVSDFLAVQDDQMCIAEPGTHFPLVQAMENGKIGHVVWVRWV